MREASAWVASAVVAAAMASSTSALANETVVCAEAAENAQALRSRSAYRDARRELLVCMRESCPAVVRADCGRWLDELDRATPTIVIAARDDAGRDVPKVRVFVDGALFAEILSGKPTPIDPGEHRFRYERVGYNPIEETLVVAAGEHQRVIRIQGWVPSAAAQEVDRGTSPSSEPGRSRSSVAGFVIGGIGLVGLGVGTVFGIRALSLNSEAKDLCPKAPCTDGNAEEISRDALTSANVANVAVGIGIVGLGVGALLLLTSGGQTRSPAAPKTTAFVGPGWIGGRW